MTKKFNLLFLVILLSLPVNAIAMKGMDHGNDNGTQGKMKMGSMFMLGSEEVDGVKASAHLMDVKEEMAKHGMKMTHHIMVKFVDITNSDNIENGQVAVKVEDPSGNVSKAHKLMGMDGHFGVDLTLDQKGTYTFKIATKLPDGKKRTFNFQGNL